jgi:hypothetical protein
MVKKLLKKIGKKAGKDPKTGAVSKMKMGGAVKSGTQQLTGFGKARRR